SRRQSVSRLALGNFSAARPRWLPVSSTSQRATTATCGLAATPLRSDQPWPPTPTEATRSFSLAPYTRDQPPAVSPATPAAPVCKNLRRVRRDELMENSPVEN